MRFISRLILPTILLCLLSLTQVHATLSSSISSQLGYTDNLLKTSDKLATAQQKLTAQMNIAHQWKRLNSDCGVSGAATRYQASEKDNVSGTHFYCGISYQPNSQHALTGNLKHQNADEIRGTGISKNAPENISRPDQYTHQNLSLAYQYKTSQLQGLRLTTALKQVNKTYQSERNIALQNNRQQNNLDLTIGYQSRKNTYWFAHYGISDNHFNNAIQRNNTLDTMAIGLAWQATGMTGFTAEIGQQNITNEITKHKAAKKSEYWSVSANWSPKTYSTLTLNSRSYFQSSLLNDANLQQSQTLNLNWRHGWSNRLISQIGVSYQKHQQDSKNNRTEKLKLFDISVAYTFNDRVNTKLSWQLQNNHDNLKQYSYRQQQVFLTVNLAWQT